MKKVKFEYETTAEQQWKQNVPISGQFGCHLQEDSSKSFYKLELVVCLCLQVAHLPDKANNYLTPALSVLEKNTWSTLHFPSATPKFVIINEYISLLKVATKNIFLYSI